MELLFVVLIGALLGLLGHALLPHRRTSGIVLLPAVGAAVGAGVWAALTWAGLPFDGGWIWAVTLVAAALGIVVTGVVLGRTRTRDDEQYFQRVARNGATAR